MTSQPTKHLADLSFAERFQVRSIEDIVQLAGIFDGLIRADHYTCLKVDFENWVKASAFDLAIHSFGILGFARTWQRKQDQVVIYLKDEQRVDPGAFNETIECNRLRRDMVARYQYRKSLFDTDWTGRSLEASLAWLGHQPIKPEPIWRLIQCDIVEDGSVVRHTFCRRRGKIMDLTRFPYWWDTNEYFQELGPSNFSDEYSYLDWMKIQRSAENEGLTT